MTQDGTIIRQADDLVVGEVIDVGTYNVTLDEMLEFARQWDPQVFHIDEVAARAGYFGEIIGSGLHAMSIFQRLAVLRVYNSWDVIAGRAIHDVQLTAPLKAGAALRGTLAIENIDFVSPRRALVSVRGELYDGDTLLLSMLADSYIRRRPAQSTD